MTAKAKLDPILVPQIKACVALGDSVQEVARNLGLRPEDVRPHVSAARRDERRRAARGKTVVLLTCLKCGTRFESKDRRANRLCEKCAGENADLPAAAEGMKNSAPRRGGGRDE